MEMVFSPLALIVVVVFGLFVLGGIAVVVMLLANSKTRVVGAVLLTIGLLLAAVFGVAVLRYRAVRYDRRQVQEARVMIEMERAAEEVRARESAIRESEPLSPDMNEETPVPEPAAEPAEEVEPTEALGQVEPAPQTEPEKLAAAEDAPVANEDAPVASEKPDKSGNVLRAMARALGKALGDARKQTKGNVPADGGEDSASDVSVKTEVSPATVESEPAAPETEAGDDEAADDQAASETAEEQPPTIPDDREPAAGPGSDETTKTGTVIPAAATPEVCDLLCRGASVPVDIRWPRCHNEAGVLVGRADRFSEAGLCAQRMACGTVHVPKIVYGLSPPDSVADSCEIQSAVPGPGAL